MAILIFFDIFQPIASRSYVWTTLAVSSTHNNAVSMKRAQVMVLT
jgi:hypothetical protein